ncbi:outer membrane lipid asymmetry maintenance protein MlaD [Hydrogenovibrio sp. JE_KL2]|jgi:phospholipid/cholesterol/gamma-HCH transport system substrate-binding protein|uniref:outer membrane lipid asymmetry maintenance protein MlaD n=1 Tax=Hydrogenovibrio sp. JE_KL2 TaxID=2651188 RepID=UPI00128CA72D|nr:outer membrane lipid asymmetry maintenance protein MlaD [Hydrogenovibrio sp. JE_KL2]MBD3822645.1 outer membrane lipid asymmetry maintenance protein MlaD [Thiotrichales bacterium]MBN2605699.1 outer membrane lipid asymmetry maintenance protein MlaD [Thiotrichales bacterium]MPQ76190.1 outer membrane lipid asymmetry maintenance protein MlaD [Hydrogenovibrio sp. JE_KL2]
MFRRSSIEIWVGAFVLMTLVALIFVAFKVSNFQGFQDKPTYQVSALFSNIGGLKVRAPVKISGVVVGRVDSISVDQKTYRAKVVMDIYKEYNKLSLDTSASILTSGLLGDQYIGLTPGADDEYLKNGDQIDIAQSALVLEELIGQFLTKLGDSGNKK